MVDLPNRFLACRNLKNYVPGWITKLFHPAVDVGAIRPHRHRQLVLANAVGLQNLP